MAQFRHKKSAPTFRKKHNLHSRRPKSDSPLSQMIVALLAKEKRALELGEIAESLAVSRGETGLLQQALVSLIKNHRITKKGKQFALAAAAAPKKATLELTGSGVGFAVLEGDLPQKGKDIFISPQNLGGASHGDTVLLEVFSTRNGRREGRVMQVLERAVTEVCGIFTAAEGGGFVTPDNERLPYTVFIRSQDTLQAKNNVAVLATITDYGTERQGPSGRITRILGDATQADVQITMAIAQFGLRAKFPAEVEAEAAALTPLTTCDSGRQDLRHLPHVTIDGETARDFDDAICVEKSDQGYTLYVSIADVSHYVTTGSAIDREAYLRGTSVYMPDRVLPMLPERLSNDLCSLVPDQDRPAFTAILQFDQQGKRTGARYCKSMIRSQQRFTYTIVNEILFVDSAEMREQYASLVPMLEAARALTGLMKKQRIARGSLEFNIPEPTVQLAGNQVAAIELALRNQAHMLIEDCMLAANEAVAESLAKAQRPVLYRIHERPDPVKLETFTDATRALGLSLPASEPDPAWFATVIRQAAGSPAEYIVNNLLLRTMQQARYSPENAGHFGLAASYYLHFTSPIRRYPDLVAHRALQAWLTRAPHVALVPDGGKNDLTEAGEHLSQCERKSIDAERNVHARCSALFLLHRIGDTFPAVISGVTAFGLYLTLDDSFISGMIPVDSLPQDYYLHDTRRYRLIAQGTNIMYQLGDHIPARLDNVDLATKRITFSLAATGAPGKKQTGKNTVS